MNTLTLLGIAVGLAMDAFAVSIGIGLNAPHVSGRTTVRLAWHFGLFQFLMPISVAGGVAGRTLDLRRRPLDRVRPARGHRGKHNPRGDPGRRGGALGKDPTRGASLVVLSVATSIDALAVGLTLALLNVSILYPAFVIGVVAFAFTAVGLRLGRRFGSLFGKRVEILGGVILIGIGLKSSSTTCSDGGRGRRGGRAVAPEPLLVARRGGRLGRQTSGRKRMAQTAAGDRTYQQRRFPRLMGRVSALGRHRVLVTALVVSTIVGALLLDSRSRAIPSRVSIWCRSHSPR